MDSSELATVTQFREQIAEFFRALDRLHAFWRHQSSDSQKWGRLLRPGETAKLAVLRYRNVIFQVRDQIRDLARGVTVSIVPPPGQTAIQFVAGILDDVENVWAILRLVHGIHPEHNYDDPEDARFQQEMHVRLPAMRNTLWEAWRHIGHTVQLTDAVEPMDSPVVPTGDELQLATDEDGKRDGVRWQAAAKTMLEMRNRGDAFTSQSKLAKKIGCSSFTINKAIKNTPDLSQWAEKQHGSATGMLSLNDGVTNSASQECDPDPSDILERVDHDEALRYLIEQAQPEERAKINTMDPASQRQLAETAYRDPDTAEQLMRWRRKERGDG